MPAITSEPDSPAWDVDADWWGPAWGAVTPVGADPDKPGEDASELPDPDPAPPYVAAPDPSWGHILATTVTLWLSRRRHPRATPRLPRAAGWASAVWGAHARLLSAAMLSAGLLAAGAGTAGLLVTHTSSDTAARTAPPPSPVATPTGRTVLPVTISALEQAPKPVWLTIPAIGVRAPIINLGLNKNGTLQVPSTTTVAGWYTGSPRPGATGSAVIAGHVDSYTGPGVFFWLKKMRPGERIYVRRADGTLAVFTVTAVRIFIKSNFPTALVYGPVPDAELRLITCGGTFDYASRSYLSNVVVYARLST
jgi:LPXTG-site transpeptidase (sortase) family protein